MHRLSWIVHFTLSTYNVLNSVTYFALHRYGLDRFGGFRKMNIFGGMKKLWIILGGYYIGLIWGIISIHFRAFFLRQGSEWDFWGSQNFKYLFGNACYSWYFYWVNRRCWVQAYVCRVPPPNDPRPKRLPAEMTHQNRPNLLTPKFGRNDPAETTHGRNDPDSSDLQSLKLLCSKV